MPYSIVVECFEVSPVGALVFATKVDIRVVGSVGRTQILCAFMNLFSAVTRDPLHVESSVRATLSPTTFASCEVSQPRSVSTRRLNCTRTVINSFPARLPLVPALPSRALTCCLPTRSAVTFRVLGVSLIYLIIATSCALFAAMCMETYGLRSREVNASDFQEKINLRGR